LPWAYLALFNSGAFEEILGLFLSSLSGSLRVEAAAAAQVFLPDLSDPERVLPETVNELGEIGRTIHAGRMNEVDQAKLDHLTLLAYGLPSSVLR